MNNFWETSVSKIKGGKIKAHHIIIVVQRQLLKLRQGNTGIIDPVVLPYGGKHYPGGMVVFSDSQGVKGIESLRPAEEELTIGPGIVGPLVEIIALQAVCGRKVTDRTGIRMQARQSFAGTDPDISRVTQYTQN